MATEADLIDKINSEFETEFHDANLVMILQQPKLSRIQYLIYAGYSDSEILHRAAEIGDVITMKYLVETLRFDPSSALENLLFSAYLQQNVELQKYLWTFKVYPVTVLQLLWDHYLRTGQFLIDQTLFLGVAEDPGSWEGIRNAVTEVIAQLDQQMPHWRDIELGALGQLAFQNIIKTELKRHDLYR